MSKNTKTNPMLLLGAAALGGLYLFTQSQSKEPSSTLQANQADAAGRIAGTTLSNLFRQEYEGIPAYYSRDAQGHYVTIPVEKRGLKGGLPPEQVEEVLQWAQELMAPYKHFVAGQYLPDMGVLNMRLRPIGGEPSGGAVGKLNLGKIRLEIPDSLGPVGANERLAKTYAAWLSYLAAVPEGHKPQGGGLSGAGYGYGGRSGKLIAGYWADGTYGMPEGFVEQHPSVQIVYTTASRDSSPKLVIFLPK